MEVNAGMDWRHNPYVASPRLDDFMQMQPVSSSNIEAIGYESGTLHVRFKGGATYAYSGVPFGIWEDFRDSVSKGSYFAAYIKNQYSTERL